MSNKNNPGKIQIILVYLMLFITAITIVSFILLLGLSLLKISNYFITEILHPIIYVFSLWGLPIALVLAISAVIIGLRKKSNL